MSKDTERMIERLQEKLKPIEEEAVKIKKGINLLCELDDRPVIYASIEDGPVANIQLRGDEYHNMAQATAITEILQRRKNANLAPVTIDEVYEDLIAGGFEFTKGKNVAIQKRGIAIAMSKNRKFYRLPNERWGIKSWYGVKDSASNSSKALADTPNKEPAEKLEEPETQTNVEDASKETATQEEGGQ